MRDTEEMLARFARHPDAFAKASTPEQFADLVSPGSAKGDGAVVRMYVEKGNTWTRLLFYSAKTHGLDGCSIRPLYMPTTIRLADIIEDVRYLPLPQGQRTREQSDDAVGGRTFISGLGVVPFGSVGGRREWSPDWLARGERLRSHRGCVSFGTYARPTKAAQEAFQQYAGYRLGGLRLIRRNDGKILVTGHDNDTGIFQCWMALLDEADAVALMPQEDQDLIAREKAAEAAAWEEETPGLPRVVHEGRAIYWEVAPGVYNVTDSRETPPKGAAGYLNLAALHDLKTAVRPHVLPT